MASFAEYTIYPWQVLSNTWVQTFFDNLPDKALVRFAPGIFDIGNGIYVNSKDVRIIGAGRELTTLRIEDDANLIVAAGAVGSSLYGISINRNVAVGYSGDSVVSDLTLDLNWAGRTVKTDNVHLGVRMYCGGSSDDHMEIRRLRVIGCGQDNTDVLNASREAFYVGIYNNNDGTEPYGLIDDVIFEQDSGDYGMAVILGTATGVGDTANIRGTISNCNIVRSGAGGGIGVSRSFNGVEVRNNYVDNRIQTGLPGEPEAYACFTHDSGSHFNLRIRGNTFRGASTAVPINIGVNSGDPDEDTSITDNIIESDDPAGGHGIHMEASTKRTRISGNTFLAHPSTPGAWAVRPSHPGVGSTALVSNNVFGPGVSGAVNPAIAGHVGIDFDDNTRVGGDPQSGVVELVLGTATIATDAVLTDTNIQLYHQDPKTSTAIGTLAVGTIVDQTSFVINALDAAAAVETGDLSEVFWELVI